MSHIGTPTRPKWAHDAIWIAARIARREWLLDSDDTLDEYNRADDSMGDAAHNLTQAIDAGCAEVVALRAEVDRLHRILAVERGDASAAPGGWTSPGWGWCCRDDFGERYVDRAGKGCWVWISNPETAARVHGTAPTALEAMEAADMAAETGGRGL